MPVFRPLAIVALMMTPITAPVAMAQTSFGKQEAVTDRASWDKAADRILWSALRRANSTLETQGRRALSLHVAVFVNRDGSLADVVILRGSGQPLIDASVERALSRDVDFPAFTPDMPDATVTLTMQIGTRAG